MLRETRANSLPFSLLFSLPPSSGILFLSLVRTSSLLIADDVTPRPCHVAHDQDGRSGFRRNYTFSPIFCPVYSRLPLFAFSFFFCLLSEKSKLLLSPGRYYQDLLARLDFEVSWIAESFMAAWFPRASIFAFISALSLSLSFFLSSARSFIFWTLSFHLLSHCLAITFHIFLFLFLSSLWEDHLSSLLFISFWLLSFRISFFFLLRKKESLNAVIRGLKRWHCVVFSNLLLPPLLFGKYTNMQWF